MSTAIDPWATTTNPETGQTAPAFDPFADDVNPETAGGGMSNKHSFPRLNQLPENGGHVVILVPKSYDPQAPSNYQRNGKNTVEEFSCELHVLAGPGTKVEKREKNEQTGKYESTGQFYAIGDGSEYPWPISWTAPTIRVNQGILVGQLKNVFDVKTGEQINGGLWVGRLRHVPNPNSPKHLQNATPDQMDAALKAHRQALGQGDTTVPDPKGGIKLMNATPEEKAAARAYWQSLGR